MLFQQFIDNRKLRKYFPLSVQYQKWWRSGVKDKGDKNDLSGGRVIFPFSLYRKLVIVEYFLAQYTKKRVFPSKIYQEGGSIFNTVHQEEKSISKPSTFGR
jgi:hypothetical protein